MKICRKLELEFSLINGCLRNFLSIMLTILRYHLCNYCKISSSCSTSVQLAVCIARSSFCLYKLTCWEGSRNILIYCINTIGWLLLNRRIFITIYSTLASFYSTAILWFIWFIGIYLSRIWFRCHWCSQIIFLFNY